jgi:hypothetical protein
MRNSTQGKAGILSGRSCCVRHELQDGVYANHYEKITDDDFSVVAHGES